jgi:hypothetical protein
MMGKWPNPGGRTIMKLTAYPRMFVSYHAGWDGFRDHAPSIARIFLLLVLPFSLVPAGMLAFVVPSHAADYAYVTGAGHYRDLAALFLFTELLTVPLMAMAIHSITTSRGKRVDFRHCFLLAALAPIPMWLSALTLWVPNVAFNISCGLAGLAGACALLVHGIPTLLDIDEGVDAQEISMVVMFLGALVWALLVAIVLVPLTAA